LEGIENSDVEQVKDLTIDYAALSKLAIDYSDGIIQSSEVVNQEVLEYVNSKNMKYLPYQSKEDYADAFIEFYDSLIE
jgi:starch synthase